MPGWTERTLQSRYRIVRQLGSGGLGTVFLCEDLRLPGKQWAVKQLKPPAPGRSERFRRTFEREAAVLARLRHPHLPVVVDYFEEDDHCYLVMERVEGENLAEHVRRVGSLGEREAFEYGLILVDLLDFLHHQDPPVVFRDLKPENVMRPPDGQLRLVDFGLCRPFLPGGQVDTVPSGSVGYAAPEQWEEFSCLDGRSDLYSWGATMLYLLTGRKPATVDPLPAPANQVPGLSPEGGRILVRCLEATPQHRYASARELKGVVERHLATLPPTPPAQEPAPVSQEESEAPSPTEARRWPLVVLSVVLVAALLAWLALRPSAPARPAGPASPVVSSQAAGVTPYQLGYQASPDKEQARKLYSGRRFREALVLLERAVRQHPDDAEARILRENAQLETSGVPLLHIPFIGSLTGVDGTDSFSQLHGLAISQMRANAKGGVKGRKIVVDLHDDASSTTRCLQIAQALVKDSHVSLVVGPYNSQRTTAVAPMFNAARLPLLAPVASSTQIWESGGPYVFSASDSTERRVRALTRYLVAKGHRRIGVVVDETSRISREMAQGMVDEAAAVAREGGPTIEHLQLPSYQEGTQDFSPQVEAIRRLQPDVVFLCDYRVPITASLALQVRAAGLGVRLCSQTVPFTPDLVQRGGTAVDGLLLPAYFHPDLGTAGVRSFVSAFRATFGGLTPTHLAANTYDAFNAAVEALEEAPTREGVRRFLRASGNQTPPFQGVMGPFATGRLLDARPVWIIEVRDGRYRLLEEAQPTPVR